ncbi:MAG: hypothetical protein M3480_05825 [Verrucomicrobiota bacterium]|nr:hypothetical protein [Verrucomicrobiota bacterium]
MSAASKIFLAFVVALCLTTGAGFAAGKPRSTSTSRQFVVYGADVRVRGALCDLAERTKSNLLQLLGQRDNWKTALVVNLDYPRANFPDAAVAQLAVSQLGFGLKLQLNLLLTREMKGRAVQRELLRAILVEMMYRNRGNIAAGSPYVTPPDWLVEGVLALEPGNDTQSDAELLRTILATPKIAPLEEIVRQKQAQLDAPSRQLHSAYSRALVQLLIDTRGGRSQLARFISDLPDAPTDAMADLRAHFPETLGRAPGKWWALSVAELSAKDRYQMLSAAETGRRLDQALRFSIPAKDGKVRDYSLGEFENFRKLPARRDALRQVGQQLQLLGAQAHPSYRAIVQEAYALTELLVRGKTRGVAARLERIARYRAVIEQQGTEIDDYLNWFEATQSKTSSGVFSQILEADRKTDEAPPRRRDPISVYLDSIEMDAN